MMTDVFLRILSDLGIYLSITGPAALHFGASEAALYTGWIILSAALFISCLLSRRGVLRFLPFAAAAAVLILAGPSIAEALVFLPPFIYVVYLAASRRYGPDRDTVQQFFTLFPVLLTVVTIVCLFAGAAGYAARFTLPVGLITLSCQVLLLRSLRHGTESRRSPRRQITDILLIAALASLILFLGSETGTSLILTALGAVYRVIVMPVLELLLRVFIAVLSVIGRVFSFIGRLFRRKLSEPEPNEPEIGSFGFEDIFGDRTQAPELPRALEAAVIIIAAAAAAFLLFLLFRRMAARAREEKEIFRVTAEETAPGEKHEKAVSVRDRGAVRQVRSAYRRWLRRGAAHGIQWLRSDTTMDIRRRFSGFFPDEESQELRELYIRARYDGRAGPEDAARARELLRHMTKNSRQHEKT